MEITLHTNWRDAFPVQEVGENNLLFVLYVKSKPTDGLLLTIEKREVVCDLNEDELVAKLSEEMQKFTQVLPVPVNYNDTERALFIKKEQNNVARRSRRGVAKSRWNNTVYYRSNPLFKDDGTEILASQSDGPIIVGEKNGKFGYVLNPHFDDYGFIVQDVCC